MGLSSLISKNSFILSKLQSGYIYHYTFLILITSTVLLGLRNFWLSFSDFVDIKLFIIFILSFFLLGKSKN